MVDYLLTQRALLDLEEIRRYLQREASLETADRMEAAFFDAFEELVRLPPMGHRRSDVRPEKLRFHNVSSYVIAFHREPRVVIVRVVHGARQIKRML